MKEVWSALSDSTRREILSMLKERDMTAGEIADKFQITKPTISHHLAILKEAGLLNAVKSAQTITYSLNVTVFQGFMKTVADMFGKKGE